MPPAPAHTVRANLAARSSRKRPASEPRPIPTMTAQVLDGTALSEKIRGALAARVEALTSVGSRPGLTVILVGDDPASQVYVRNKVKACERIGIRSDLKALPQARPRRSCLA